jgi:hypothetical protein
VSADDDVVVVKSDIYPDDDGASWSLRAPDGRSAKGRAPSVYGAERAMHMQIDEWYPDEDEGQVTIVRIVP